MLGQMYWVILLSSWAVHCQVLVYNQPHILLRPV